MPTDGPIAHACISKVAIVSRERKVQQLVRREKKAPRKRPERTGDQASVRKVVAMGSCKVYEEHNV